LEARGIDDWLHCLPLPPVQFDVHPVVVVWGAGEKDVPAGGGLIDGVAVVAGQEIAAWL
jgi:hypothetical protein